MKTSKNTAIATIVKTVSFTNAALFFQKMKFANSLTSSFKISKKDVLELADQVENSTADEVPLENFKKELVTKTATFVSENFIKNLDEKATKAKQPKEAVATAETLEEVVNEKETVS